MKQALWFGRWGPVVLWAAFIFYLSSLPNLRAVQNPRWDEILRSGLHALFYAFFFLLWYRALKGNPRRTTISMVGCLSYALFDEIHQYFVPTRTFQIQDLLVDFIGCLGGAWGVKNIIPGLPPKLTRLAEKLGLS